MNRTPVKSASILSIGYDKEKREMDIEFSSLAVYRYFDIPPAGYKAFMQSSSKGSFFITYIRPRPRYQCIVPRPQGAESHGSESEKAKAVKKVKSQVAARAQRNRAYS